MLQVQTLPLSLLDLLSNILILYHTVPYLPISTLLSLATASKSFHHLIYNTPHVFRYLDLSTVKGASVEFAPIDAGAQSWRSQRMDEYLTEEDIYSGPLRGIFSSLKRNNVLQDVQILILDGLSVTAEMIREIVCDDSFNVRILSIRGVKNLNDRKLKQVLKYVCRPGRASGTPKLKGLYYFNPRPAGAQQSSKLVSPVPTVQGVTTSLGAQLGSEWNQRSQQALSSTLSPTTDPWYHSTGHLQKYGDHVAGWADILKACNGIICFDAVLCRGPRHDEHQLIAAIDDNDRRHFLGPMSATVVIGPRGCQVCHSAPEGPAIAGVSPPEQLPLLDPPPRHTSSASAAQRLPSDSSGCSSLPLFVRCMPCLSDRWCAGCNKFWCESCYQTKETSTYTQMQKVEAMENMMAPGLRMGIKVHLGLCIEDCIVGEMYNGAGSGGMWG